MKTWWQAAIISLQVLAGSADCTYLKNPDEFLHRPEQRWQELSKVTAHVASFQQTQDSAPMPRNNFIDDYIFGRMERDGIRPAPISDDSEFLRRIDLDLMGRIPSADRVRSFIDDPNPSKRELLIDSLIGSPEFIDKWTMFFGDLFKNDGPSSNVNRYLPGRDAFYAYLKDSIAANKPYDRMAREIITANGDTFQNGPVNWVVGGTVPMGPVQDTYDGQAANLAQMFLGINAVDCLLCHDGPHHLDNVNLWGKQQKRADMQGLAAFFARTQMARETVTQDPFQAQFKVTEDLYLGECRMNKKTGNRTPRESGFGEDLNVVDPRYPFFTDSNGAGKYRREVLANSVTGEC